MPPPIAPPPCVHCGRPSRPDSATCCDGCDAAHRLIAGLSLDRYYDLGGRAGAPPEPPRAGTAFVDAAWAERRRVGEGEVELELDVQGIRCAACVWIIDELFRREPGARASELVPGRGQLRARVDERSFDLGRFAERLATLGYRLAPRGSAKGNPAQDELVVRLGVCVAIAMNAMLMSLPLYLGVDEPRVRGVMGWAAFGLGTAAVVVGGTPFVKSAVTALRRGLLHLDVPIALGLLAAYGGSVVSFFRQDGRASYFDTLATFIALMLFGRWLTERVLEKNRRALLSERPLGRFPVRVVKDGRVDVSTADALRAGDEILLRPGDLCPTEAELTSDEASVSLAWLTGEESPVRVARGEPVIAGAFLRGDRAAHARVTTPFEASRLPRLAPPPLERDDLPRATAFFQRLARTYVIAVLVVAATAGAAWWALGPSGDRALEVVVGVLVVTCPCAFGIAAPLAYELVQADLARHGVRVRSRSLLDRLLAIRHVLFDKTGTLTLGDLDVASPERLFALPPADREVILAMAIRSRHPKSEALARALRGGTVARADVAPRETPGRGLEAVVDGHTFRVGAVGWAGEGTGDLVLSRDGEVLADLHTTERIPAGTREAAAALASLGLELHVLSGDHAARVHDVARRVGIATERAAASPEAKAEYVASVGASRALFVGDGVNDVLAARAALASGTPMSDLPVLPAHTDFDVEGPVIEGVQRAMLASRRLAHVVREALAFALVYNAASILLCVAGVMSPLLAAVVMPISSVVATGWVTLRLRDAAALPRDASGTPRLDPVEAAS